jgi:hypothetical protein
MRQLGKLAEGGVRVSPLPPLIPCNAAIPTPTAKVDALFTVAGT